MMTSPKRVEQFARETASETEFMVKFDDTQLVLGVAIGINCQLIFILQVERSHLALFVFLFSFWQVFNAKSC